MTAPFRGVILDIDGTLVDSNDAHAQAWAEAFSAHGFQTSFEQVRPLVGMGSDKLLPAAVGLDRNSAQGTQISEERKHIFAERYLPRLRAFPGTRELLARMRERGLRLVVASSAEREELQALLLLAGAEDLIEAQTSSSDAESSKPAPDIVQVALEKLGTTDAEVVMLGDTPYDVEAATRAGIAIIALRCGGWDDDALKEAIAIYDGPADLLAHYDESPLARGLERTRG